MTAGPSTSVLPITCAITRPLPSPSVSAAPSAIAGPSTQTTMPARQVIPKPADTPATVPSTAATHTTGTLPSTGGHLAWARATQYKRKHQGHLLEVGAKLSRVQNIPVCTLCAQPTQGHRRYKKKTFCPIKMMSSSKGLDNRVYASYEDCCCRQVGGLRCKYALRICKYSVLTHCIYRNYMYIVIVNSFIFLYT